MNICEIIFYDLYNENAENWKDSAAFCVMFKNFLWFTLTQTQFIWKYHAEWRWLQVEQNFS